MEQLLQPYWSQSLEALLARLQTSIDGLGADDARQRLTQYGPNALKVREKATAWQLFLGQFRNPLVLILIFAAIVSATAREWVDMSVVLAIVLGSALLSFVQEYNASNAVERLRARLTLMAKVVRNLQEQSIPAQEVVPGDIVLLSAGSLIPADGLLLQSRDFYVNRAVLTGETFPVEKRPGAVDASASLAERTNPS